MLLQQLTSVIYREENTVGKGEKAVVFPMISIKKYGRSSGV